MFSAVYRRVKRQCSLTRAKSSSGLREWVLGHGRATPWESPASIWVVAVTTGPVSANAMLTTRDTRLGDHPRAPAAVKGFSRPTLNLRARNLHDMPVASAPAVDDRIRVREL